MNDSDIKIDRSNKTFVFPDGEVLPIPKDKQKQVLRSKAGQKSKQEAIEKWQDWQGNVPVGESGHALINSASESLFGNLGDTLANYAVSGVKSFSPGEGQEEMGYVDRVLDHFYAMQEGRKEHLAGLQERNPIASNVGKGIGIAGELGTLYGVPGAVALPIMGAGSSETSFLEPEEKLKEVVPQAIEGAILDKFFGSLSKVAGNRETQRELKDIISNTERGNAAELSRARAATEAEQLRFGQENASRELQLQRLPELQKAENAAFQAANETAAQKIAKTIGKGNLSNEVLGVEEFISKSIDTSAHAASTEGNQAGKFLRTIFKGDKNGKINAESLKRGMKALDEAIIKNEGNVKNLLTEYKEFLNKSLPERLASNYVYEKWAPKLFTGTEKIESNLGKMLNHYPDISEPLTKRLGKDYIEKFNSSVNNSVKNTLENFKNNFTQIDPALMKEEISNAIKLLPEYQNLSKRIGGLFADYPAHVPEKWFPGFGNLKTSIQNYPEILAEKISKNLNKYQPDVMLDFSKKGGVTRNSLENAPISPNMIPAPASISPTKTISPNLAEVPVMPTPQGIYGKLAAGLEGMRDMNPAQMLSHVKGGAPTALLAKMSGIPLAKAGLGAAGIATGLRALTSPSTAGKFMREGLGQASRSNIGKIDALAQKYPSYNNGIVELPQHRRSLTKEIENLSDLSLEEKAIFQSKINRGKPLSEKL
jgi:hypothetical protein